MDVGGVAAVVHCKRTSHFCNLAEVGYAVAKNTGSGVEGANGDALSNGVGPDHSPSLAAGIEVGVGSRTSVDEPGLPVDVLDRGGDEAVGLAVVFTLIILV